MDWRERKYYTVTFAYDYDMRRDILKNIHKIKFIPYKDVDKLPDEIEERGYYQFIISVPIEHSGAVEYELNKAKRRDEWCRWKEIKRDFSKKYFDIYGNIMPYRKCDIHPYKRCNHCGDC